MTIAKLLAVSLVFSGAVSAQLMNGRWDCSVTVNGNEIPFAMEFSSKDSSVSGNFFNGEEQVPSTGGELGGDALRLNFDQHASRLEATLKDGGLEGRYGRGGRWYDFRGRPAVDKTS